MAKEIKYGVCLLYTSIVKKYNSPDRDLDDLISIGTIGLIKAVNTFDLNKGGRLVTYAARCIENELLMMIRQEKKILREVSLYEPIGTDQEEMCIRDRYYVRRSDLYYQS